MNRNRKPVGATEPIVLEFLAIHEASGVKDMAIAQEAGVSRSYISNMRRGALDKPAYSIMNRLLATHGYELVIRKKSSD